MADPVNLAKLRFLEASAHQFALTAPETSAHLMKQSQVEAEASTDKQKVRKDNLPASCKACGTLLIPGWTSRTTINTPNKTKKNDGSTDRSRKLISKASLHPAKSVKVDCLRCHRFEQLPLEHSPRRKERTSNHSDRNKTLSSPENAAFPVETSKESIKPISANASSKQRSKTRKRGGLQALLDQSKTSMSTPACTELGLLDLMTEG